MTTEGSDRLVIEGDDLRILRENVAYVHRLDIQDWQRSMRAMSIADYLESRLERLYSPWASDPPDPPLPR